MVLGKTVAASIAALVPGDMVDRGPEVVGMCVQTVAGMAGATTVVLVGMHML